MRFLRQWLPVVVWAGLILSASNDRFSSDHTIVLAQRLLGAPLSEIANIVLRKAAHIFEYSVLAWLAWRAHRTMTLPILVALVVSSTDEWLQSHTVARTGTAWDVVLDVCAAFVVVGLLTVSQSHSRTVAQSHRSLRT